MAESDPADRREGRTTLRVHGFADHAPEFDPIQTYAPLLEACREIIGGPFKLSALLGRTLLAARPAQELHVDCPRNHPNWPLAAFIFMIDSFRDDNGATFFLPASHLLGFTRVPGSQLVQACGPAGSLIIYHGSIWHGHGANTTAAPRRSIQGSFIRAL